MVGLTVPERIALERASLARRAGAARIRLVGSRLSRTRRNGAVDEGLLIVPRELRAADPSFASEVAAGLFGLGGDVVNVTGRSVFDVTPPSAAWQSEFDSFGWLRNMAVPGDDTAHAVAVSLVSGWIKRYGRRRTGPAWRADVAGRRLMSWLNSGDALLNDVSDSDYARLMASIRIHMAHLARRWETAPPGVPRLIALIALVLATTVIEGQERARDRSLVSLVAELDRQVLPDGGHVSRHPGALVEPLIDLHSLTTSLRSLRVKVPDGIEAARARALRFLRFMRTADGSLARFNGVAVTSGDKLATLFSHADDLATAPDLWSTHTKYARLETGGVLLLADLGSAPALVHAGAAAAGALSFELGIDGEPIFLNVGACNSGNPARDHVTRKSSSHNTVSLAAASSARLVDDPAVIRHVGMMVAIGPQVVELIEPPAALPTSTPGPKVLAFSARHDGYAARFGLWHSRRIAVGGADAFVVGEDVLDGRGKSVRLARDVSFAIHFHVAPNVQVAAGRATGSAHLITRTGRRYMFAAEGAALFYRRMPSPEPSRRMAAVLSDRFAWRVIR